MNITTALNHTPATIRQQTRAVATGEPEREPSVDSHHNGVLDSLMGVGFFAFNELVEIGKNDPALALRYGATSLSEQLLKGVDNNVRVGFDSAIIPTIRLSILGANGYRLNQTLKDPTAHIAEKAFDTARVATDVIGLAGSVLKYAWPAKAALGDTLVGVSYAADAVSHSVRGMTHGASRAVAWKKMLETRKEASKKKETPGAGSIP